jgi:GT2 family glycosyltransferase
MSDIDVVIVNYRSAAHTVACVRELRAAAGADGTGVMIVVVNNGDSAADLEARLKPHGPVAFIHNRENQGFGAACNLGAASSSARLILFLNPDAMPKPGCLRAMTDFMDDPANARVGIAGPAIEDETGVVARTSSSLPGFFGLLARSLGLGRGFLAARDHERSGPVGQVMGAVMMVRRRLFDDLGGFDRRFFLYYEDVDLCARAAAKGALTYYLAHARARHVGRVSSSQDSGMALAHFLNSRLTYARLHFGVLAQGLLLAATYLGELPLRLLRTPFGGRSITGAAVLRAYRLLTIGLLSGVDLAGAHARRPEG